MGDWPADVYAEWDSLPSPGVVEIEMNAVHKGQGRRLVVNYGSIEDALTKLDYIEKNGAIAEGEVRGARKQIEHLRRRYRVTASRFSFKPLNEDIIKDLVREKGWAKYRSALTKTINRKTALAGEGRLVSFCVPHEQYRDVLKEIKAVPEMRVAFVYPFKESEEGIEIAGAIPVFQGVSPKSYLKHGKEKRV